MIRGLYALAIVCTIVSMPFIAQAQAPVANFSANNTAGCSPVVVQFTDLSTNSPTSWFWDLGNGGTSTIQNPAASYITPGTYTVILTATNASGSSKDTSYITVHTSPTVAFTADTTTTCGSKTVQFTNNTIPGAGGAVSYLWDFGDGDSSTVLNPVHTYNYSGSFTVSLVVSNSSGCTSSLTKNAYINILPKPTSSFSANNTSSCNAPFQVTFTNASTNATSYEWDFGDGNTSTATSPSNTYISSGSYTVRLISTGPNGCKDTLTRSSYIVIGQVNAGFTVSSPTCVGTPTNFTNTTTPGLGGSRIWDFGNSSTDTAANPAYTYTTAGTYTVTLIEQYANNCNDTFTQSVTVSPSPTANFTSADTVGCIVPFNASFTNTSTGATSYTWSFGAGSSNLANPSFVYNSTGIYNVSLTATSAAGCTSITTKNSYVKIQAPTGTLTASQTGACINEPIDFSGAVDTPLYASNYRWDFGDGSSIISCASCSTQSHSYSSIGTYNVQLIVSTASGCDDTLYQSITISTKPSAGFSATPLTVCPDATVSFTNSSTGATSYTWRFGDGLTAITTNPGHSYNNPGTYSVTLVADSNGCKDTFTRTNYITINLPLAKFGASFTCNAPLTYNFTDSSVGANVYSWDFGDATSSTTAGNVSHTYATAGTYNVVLRVTNTSSGCVDSMALVLNVSPIVAPNFIASDTTICRLEVVVFTPQSSAGLTFDWYFQNQIKYDIQPRFEAQQVGTFDVKMVVTDSFGCKDSLTKSNMIKVGGANVGFTASTLNPCKETSLTFTDTSTTGAFAVVNRHWDFGDGTDLDTTSTTVAHSYGNTGPYNIKLIITDANGCKDSLTKNSFVYVNKPIAQFYSNDTSICAGDTVKFNNNSGGNSFTSAWDFGDGNTSTITAPTHVYNALGNYSVKLVLTDIFGCMDSVTHTDYIKVQQPTAAFTMSDSVAACPPLTVYFGNTTTGAVSYLWTFGNNNQSSNASPSTIYTYPGVYTVKMVATNASGCKDSATNTVTVNGPTGTYSYTPLAGCTPVTVTFTATSSNTSSYIWDMNNGYTQTTSAGNFSYTYTQTGKYVPRLILSDGASCQVPLQNTDTVSVDQIDADFSFTAAGNLCNTDTVYFDDTISYTLSGVASRSWDFGDGSSSSSEDPTHFYNMPGNYSVQLIITNTNGCSDTITKTVIVRGLPTVIIAASTDSICPGQPTGAQLTAIGASTYTWTPTTGLSCSNCPNPIATPVTTTTYIVTGTDTNGCMNTDTVTIVVNPKPVINVRNDTTICEGNYTPLLASGASTYTWTPATGLSCTACSNPFAGPTTTVTYTAIGSNTFGCTDTADVTVTIIPKPVVDAGTDQTICNGDTALLIATGASTYTWTPTTALSCTTCDSTYANPSSTTTYSAIGTAANGCLDTATVTVNVNPLPNVNAGADTSICLGFGALLQATGATTYTWTPATGLSCTSCASPTATPTTTTTYIVTGLDGNSCQNEDTVIVTVNPQPSVSAGNDETICEGFSVALQATGATTYTWTPATGLSCTSCSNPTAAPTTTTAYIVTGTDVNTCSDTDTVVVNVNLQPTVTGTDKEICPADSAQLLVTGADTYTWTPATGLSCTSCDSPKASPNTTTVYTVVGTDANGCKDTSTVTVTVNAPPVVTVTNDTAICINDSTTLLATGADTYTWSPATGLSCTSCASPVAKPTTTTTYSVIGENSKGCLDTATVTVTVNPLPNVNAGNDETVCVGFGITLQATGATSYTWTPTTGLSCTTCPNPTATPPTTTTYIVTGTDTNTCVNTDTVIVNVNPQPTVTGADGDICPADSVQLQASGADTYTWTPTAGLSCSNCDNPKASPNATTSYTVVGTDANGCKDTTTITVTVNAPPTLTVSNDTAICIGDNATLIVSGAAAYTWSPSTTLSCINCANPTANPTVTTTYTVVGANGNSCKDTATVTVTINPLPNVTAGADDTVCIGFSIPLQANGATSYTWTPTTGLSCSNCPNPTATPATTTTYIVTGTDGNTCVNTDTVVVHVNPQPTVSGGSNTSICPADSAQLQATGAVTYIWSPTTGLSCSSCPAPKASPNTTTTYTVIGTNANGCKDTAMVTVTINAAPVVSAGSDVAICINDNTALQASGATTYTWTPSTGLSCTNCANPTANPATTTTYTVVGANGNGCLDTATVTVTVNPLPNISAGADQTTCIGFGVALQATGATTYTWTPATGLTCTNCPNPTATPTTTTTYIVTGTDGNTCVNTDTVIVNVNPQPNVDGGGNKTICFADSVQLQGTGAITYVWSPATGLSCTNCPNPKASPAATTVYTVIGTDANGCKDTATVTVNVNALPAISAGNDRTICYGSNVQLTATGGVSYTWMPPTGLSCTSCPNPFANPTTTTVYTVTGTDANGCMDTATVTVNVNPLPNVSAGSNQSICLNDTAQLSASGALTYTWTPTTGLSCTNCPNPKASPPATTVYTVSGTDANGCVNNSTITVTVLPLPLTNAGNDATICIGDTAQLQASGADTYIWTPVTGLSCFNCAAPKASPATTTQYVVTGTGTNTCVANDTIIVNVNPLPTVSVNNDTAICEGESIQMLATGAANYVWTPTTKLSCGSCSNPVASPDTTTTYLITGTDNNGCVDTADVTITVKKVPIISVSATRNLVCDGDTTLLQATGGNTYTWQPNTILSCATCAITTATLNSQTLFVVTGTVNGCSDTASVFVDVLQKPQVVAGPDLAFCLGNKDTLQADGAKSYTWSPATGLSCTNCQYPIASPVNTTTYTVTGIDTNGCTNTDDAKVTIYALPLVDAGDDKTICAGSTVKLLAKGAISFTWSPPAGLSCTNCPDPFATADTTTIYTVVGTDANGCVNTDSVTVSAILRQPVSYGTDDSICVGEEVTLTADGGTSYLWSPDEGLGDPRTATTTAIPAVSTKFRVIIKQGDCFTDTGFVTIGVFNPPTINAGDDQTVSGGTEVYIETAGKDIATYEWSPVEDLSCSDCFNPVIVAKRTTTYTVKGISQYGCVAEDDITIHVTCGTEQIFVANTFTPNGDGVNDMFFPQGRGLAKVERFTVYSRWGELIFDRQNMPVNDPLSGWNGTFKSEPLKPDVFVYIIRALCENGEPIEIKGDISLIR